MKTSITFKTKSEIVSAAIIDRNSTYSYGTLRELAIEWHNSDDVKINKIGTASELESDGYVHHYDMYETYVDSGSVDYAYFAINTGCEEA